MIPVILAIGLGIYAATRTPNTNIPLGNIERQTAKEGESIRKIWGISRPIAGNLVACQEPPRIQKKKQKSGGKGGGGSTTTISIPHRTYAILICEGPISGIRRAWRNNKLVYDGRDGSEWGFKNNPAFLKVFKFYLGNYEQLPDSSLQKIFGLDNVPAMRGRAYMVANDEDLQDTAGAVPQWRFEVIRNPPERITLTSDIYTSSSETSEIYESSLKNSISYGFYSKDSVDLTLYQNSVNIIPTVKNSNNSDDSEISISINSIELKGVQKITAFDESELNISANSVVLKSAVKYEDSDDSELSISINSIVIKPAVVQEIPVESLELGITLNSITLE